MLWLAIAGGVGLVVAIVALILAISAKNATSADVKALRSAARVSTR